ncbi:hypothetical protein ACH427_03200 [Streptomyces sp. NPDC020379]|uniref:hypothetical protein n=1 Tax=Streptomyces sp. NPDC020379 TaxID=3365071 RepID=UPI00378ABCD5
MREEGRQVGTRSEFGLWWVRLEAGPRNGVRQRQVTRRIRISLDEQVVGDFSRIADAGYQVVGDRPLRALVDLGEEYGSARLAQERLNQDVDPAEGEPPAPQVQEINPEMLQEVRFQGVPVVPDGADGADQFPASPKPAACDTFSANA